MTIPACPTCESLNQKSRVYDLGSSSTLLGGNFSFRGEDGKQHYHDPNKITTGYKCSEGHTWDVTRLRPCPAGCDREV